MLASMYALLVALLLLVSNSELEVSGGVQTCENCTVCEYPCHHDNPPASSGGYPMYGASPPPLPPPAQPSGGGYPVYGAPPPPYQSGQAKCPPPPQCCGSPVGYGYGYGNAPPNSYTPPSPYTYVPYGPNSASSLLPAAIIPALIFISSFISLF